MKMTREQIKTLLGAVALTIDTEISCQACQDQMAEFVESELQGKSNADAMKCIEAHLEICPECTEELNFIKKALESGELNDFSPQQS